MWRFEAFIWKRRNILAGLPLAFMLVSTRWELEADLIIWPLAFALCAIGIALRGWASCHCWYELRQPMFLATSGPYAHVRNPIYIGNLFIIAGCAVASELIWLIPAALTWAFLVYDRVVRYEEKQLLAAYGEAFLRYRDQVPRWLPRIRHPSRGNDRFQFRAVVARQALNFLILIPFALKELNLLRL